MAQLNIEEAVLIMDAMANIAAEGWFGRADIARKVERFIEQAMGMWHAQI